MNEALPYVIAAGVVLLVGFELRKYVLSHQTDPKVQALEAKVPTNVLAAAGIPAPVIDHPAIISAALQGAASVAAAVSQPQPQPVAPVAPPPAPNFTVPTDLKPAVAPAGLTAQQSQNLMLFGNINGPTPAQQATVAAAPTAATAPAAPTPFSPINGGYFLRDVAPAGASVQSPSFPMKAGTYDVTLTEGCALGQGYATLDGVGRLSASQVVVPADGTYTVSLTADPGNPNVPAPGGARLCVQFYGPK